MIFSNAKRYNLAKCFRVFLQLAKQNSIIYIFVKTAQIKSEEERVKASVGPLTI